MTLGFAGAALATLPSQAEATNQAFTTFGFQATGEPAYRTQPDRLADIKNVIDFGADSTGLTDSSAAVQNAVNWTPGANRGTIFFPPGRYLINNPITLNYIGPLSIRIGGAGAATVILGGNATGFVFDRSLGAAQAISSYTYNSGTGAVVLTGTFNNITAGVSIDVSGLNIAGVNGTFAATSGNSTTINYTAPTSLAGSPSAGGSLIITKNAQVIIENMSINPGSAGAIRLGSCSTAVVRDIQMGGTTTLTFEDSPNNCSKGILVQNIDFSGGTWGLVMGGPGSVQGCDWIGYDIAAKMYGNGWACIGNRIERCNTAWQIGLDSSTAASFNGTVASNVLTASSVTGTIAIGQTLLGSGVSSGVRINSQLTGTPGGAGTYSLSNPTFTVASSTPMTTTGTDVGASGFAIISITTEGDWCSFDLAGTCNGFYIGSASLLGHGPSNAGAVPNIQTTQYGILVRAGKAFNGEFNGITSSGPADIAAGEIDNSSSRTNVLFRACDMVQTSGLGVNWITPTNAYTAWFQNCNIQPVWIFSQLPTVGGGNDLEGDQFSISDSTTNTWGATVSGSGGNAVLVRNNGSAYTVVAK